MYNKPTCKLGIPSKFYHGLRLNATPDLYVVLFLCFADDVLELEVVWPVSVCALAPLPLDDDNVGLTGVEQLPACTDATFAPCTI